MVDRDEQVDVADAMITYGGRFVNLLGQLLQRADPFNAEKIKNTWPEYWKEYNEKARKQNGTEQP